MEDHYQGQVVRRNGALLESKRLFETCAAAQCPEVVRTACLALGEEVKVAIPTVLAAVLDERGIHVAGASVLVDAAETPTLLQGQPIELDPGVHQFHFLAPGYQSHTRTVVLAEGDPPQTVAVHLRPSSQLASRPAQSQTIASEAQPTPAGADTRPAEPAARQRTVHPLTYVFGGVALAATGSWAYFGVRALNERADCADRQPCAVSVNTKLRISGVSLGIGLASWAAGAYFLFAPRNAAPPRHRRRAHSMRIGWSPEQAAAEIDVKVQF